MSMKREWRIIVNGLEIIAQAAEFWLRENTDLESKKIYDLGDYLKDLDKPSELRLEGEGEIVEIKPNISSKEALKIVSDGVVDMWSNIGSEDFKRHEKQRSLDGLIVDICKQMDSNTEKLINNGIASTTIAKISPIGANGLDQLSIEEKEICFELGKQQVEGDK